jgi:hypothetical protein
MQLNIRYHTMEVSLEILIISHELYVSTKSVCHGKKDVIESIMASTRVINEPIFLKPCYSLSKWNLLFS